MYSERATYFLQFLLQSLPVSCLLTPANRSVLLQEAIPSSTTTLAQRVKLHGLSAIADKCRRNSPTQCSPAGPFDKWRVRRGGRERRGGKRPGRGTATRRCTAARRARVDGAETRGGGEHGFRGYLNPECFVYGWVSCILCGFLLRMLHSSRGCGTLQKSLLIFRVML